MERDGRTCIVTGEVTKVKTIRPDGDDIFTPKSLSVYSLSNTVHTAQPQ
jgi:hypothetical protein